MRFSVAKLLHSLATGIEMEFVLAILAHDQGAIILVRDHTRGFAVAAYNGEAKRILGRTGRGYVRICSGNGALGHHVRRGIFRYRDIRTSHQHRGAGLVVGVIKIGGQFDFHLVASSIAVGKSQHCAVFHMPAVVRTASGSRIGV